MTLIIGPSFSCCFSYGHGLGDVVYAGILWVGTGIYFLALIFVKQKALKLSIIPALYGSILFFLIVNIVFNRGPECSCEYLALMN